MNTDMSLPIGSRLHGGQRTYTIEQVLGQGGFGITYRAKAPIMVGNIKVMGDFALKEFFLRDDCERLSDSSISYSNPARNRVENSRKDFLNEAKRLRKLGFSHPNIVGFDEVFEANNTAYYVMEYLQGESLDGYVKKNGRLSEQDADELLQPVMNAVARLHNERICHLDIKPANIMLTHDEEGHVRPVLIDFGLSKHYDNEGHATSTINTFGYSEGYAPVEQYRGITTFSPGADIYALGATLYYCLTGNTPPSALQLRDGELAAQLPADVSREMYNRIELMTRDDRTRPTSMAELSDRVAEAMAAEEREKPVAETASKPTQRVEVGSQSGSRAASSPVTDSTPPPFRAVNVETDQAQQAGPQQAVSHHATGPVSGPVRVDVNRRDDSKPNNLKKILMIVGGVIVGLLVIFFIIGAIAGDEEDIQKNDGEVVTEEIVLTPQEEQATETPAAAATSEPATGEAQKPATTTNNTAQKPATGTTSKPKPANKPKQTTAQTSQPSQPSQSSPVKKPKPTQNQSNTTPGQSTGGGSQGGGQNRPTKVPDF